MDITSANAIIMLSSPLVFPTPFQLQQFAADNIYGVEVVAAGEIVMGVDGHLTAGFVNAPTPQSFSMMADSESNYWFEQMYANEKKNKTKYVINGVTELPAVRKVYTLTRGFLQSYSPMPEAGKTLKERKYTIVWQDCVPNPT